MIRTERLKVPTGNQLKAFFSWDWSRHARTSWGVISFYLGLAAVGGILLLVQGFLDPDAYRALLPGLAAVFLLHPWYRAGRLVVSGTLPRQFRMRPGRLPLFWLTGLIPRFVRNLVGVLALFGGLSFLIDGLGFLASGLFWVGLLASIPGALGLGLMVSGLALTVDSGVSLSWGLRRLSECFGAVLIPVSAYPGGWKFLTYLFPHRYLSETGRLLQGLDLPWFGAQWGKGTIWFELGTGTLVGLILLVLGFLVMLRSHSQARQDGRLDQGQ